MKISFCTTCKGRTEHLMQTLPRNLADNPDTDDVQVEFVVLNYGDESGMHEWMMSDPQIQEEIAKGRIIYARDPDQPNFRHSHAKNMAHRLATGDVVCNLDSDNFTGRGFAEALAVRFRKNINRIVHPSVAVMIKTDPTENGFFGRIALSRENFMRLGGYCEDYTWRKEDELEGWGGEDVNLIQRARMMNLSQTQFEDAEFLGVIPHSDEMRVENTFEHAEERDKHLEKISKRRTPRFDGNKLAGKVLNKLNANFEKIDNRVPLFQNPIVANEGVDFGKGDVSVFTQHSSYDLSISDVFIARTDSFNMAAGLRSAMGTANLFYSHFRPHIVTLTNPGAQPA